MLKLKILSYDYYCCQKSLKELQKWYLKILKNKSTDNIGHGTAELLSYGTAVRNWSFDI